MEIYEHHTYSLKNYYTSSVSITVCVCSLLCLNSASARIKADKNLISLPSTKVFEPHLEKLWLHNKRFNRTHYDILNLTASTSEGDENCTVWLFGASIYQQLNTSILISLFLKFELGWVGFHQENYILFVKKSASHITFVINKEVFGLFSRQPEVKQRRHNCR